MSSSNVRQIDAATPRRAQQGASQTARVLEAHDGHAVTVRFDDGTVLPVVAHASHLPALAEDDPVMVFPQADGVIVAFALRRAGERPQQGFAVNPDGSLSVENDRAVTIRTARAVIRVEADGRVAVEGRDVRTAADGVNRIQGATIEIN